MFQEPVRVPRSLLLFKHLSVYDNFFFFLMGPHMVRSIFFAMSGLQPVSRLQSVPARPAGEGWARTAPVPTAVPCRNAWLP